MLSLRIWHNDELTENLFASASPLAPALHYGLGVFEGIRSYATPKGPAIFCLDAHLDRMAKGAQALGMPFSIQDCHRACHEVLRANGFTEAYIRPIAYYAAGHLGLDVANHQTHLVVGAIPWQHHLGNEAVSRGVRAQRSLMLRTPARAIPPLKLCGGYVNAVLAKRQATLAGFEEALFVDDMGFVVEATSENIFIVKDGNLIAVEHPDALPGITRATLIQLTGAASRPVSLEELLDAEEVFLVGTSAEVTPLRALDDRQWAPGPRTLEVQALYQAAVRGQTPDAEGCLSY